MIRTDPRAGLLAGALGLTLFLAGCGERHRSDRPEESDGTCLDGKTIAFVGYGRRTRGAPYLTRSSTERSTAPASRSTT